MLQHRSVLVSRQLRFSHIQQQLAKILTCIRFQTLVLQVQCDCQGLFVHPARLCQLTAAMAQDTDVCQDGCFAAPLTTLTKIRHRTIECNDCFLVQTKRHQNAASVALQLREQQDITFLLSLHDCLLKMFESFLCGSCIKLFECLNLLNLALVSQC